MTSTESSYQWDEARSSQTTSTRLSSMWAGCWRISALKLHQQCWQGVVCSGLQTEGLLHCHSGPSYAYRGRLLEDGVGMEMSFHRHADWAPGEGAGEQPWLPEPEPKPRPSLNIHSFNMALWCCRTNAASTGPQRTLLPMETTRWSSKETLCATRSVYETWYWHLCR